MVFTFERFDIIKQNHDKTGLYLYHDTVGATTDPSSKKAGNVIAEVVANGFFNPAADILQVPGGLIYVTTTDGAGIYKVTQVYDSNGAAAVTVEIASTTESGLTASIPEINKACNLSAQIQKMTISGAITAGVQAVFLNHATVAIAATIANLAAHQGLLLIKAGLEPGAGQDHTVTVTTGTLNGTNKIATFADASDAILLYVDAAGNGTVLVNTGSVAFSGT